MNAKKIKKLRQLYRRDIREKLGVDKSILDVLLRDRPKYMPNRLWVWAARFYFAPNFRDKLFRNYK